MNCIGAIDGIHVSACVPSSVRGAYRDRNNEITQNVLAACSHDMMFTYVITRWEGSAHDSRIMSDAATLELFPAPYGEQYYVVDAGFPNIPGYLAPYKGQRAKESSNRVVVVIISIFGFFGLITNIWFCLFFAMLLFMEVRRTRTCEASRTGELGYVLEDDDLRSQLERERERESCMSGRLRTPKVPTTRRRRRSLVFDNLSPLEALGGRC
ncbi:hypothetical protein CRG98_010292 [Punica granatum]|uniref:DDE Tnp4 domain-containing protein n=1 Tax=Punica granatum TaxID=22663 RepID=A0A2I0KLA3_PUNGR|nr:hypothetical protein CRG98_010292 [Punica granatum]